MDAQHKCESIEPTYMPFGEEMRELEPREQPANKPSGRNYHIGMEKAKKALGGWYSTATLALWL